MNTEGKMSKERELLQRLARYESYAEGQDLRPYSLRVLIAEARDLLSQTDDSRGEAAKREQK